MACDERNGEGLKNRQVVLEIRGYRTDRISLRNKVTDESDLP